MPDDTPKKEANITVGTGIKLGIGISIGVLVVLFAILLLGVLLFRQAALPPIVGQRNGEETAPNPAREDAAAKFAALSAEEKLGKRLAGADGANKNAANGCVTTLTGPNQDMITVTAPLRGWSKEAARAFAESFIESFLSDEQTIREMIALDVISVVVTDGKRSWIRDLKTGTLTEQ